MYFMFCCAKKGHKNEIRNQKYVLLLKIDWILYVYDEIDYIVILLNKDYINI